jgi:uncharacterized RDD family membrane protein YckC
MNQRGFWFKRLFVGLILLSLAPLAAEIVYDAIQFRVFRFGSFFHEPNLPKSMEIIWACFFSLVAIWILFAAMQGRWGVTPGKWICGLRTVRTTLSPCGFAKSLYREVLLPLDNLFFISWVPGIARIAFSEKRQRVGDFAADTIVVRAGINNEQSAHGNPPVSRNQPRPS